MVLSYCEIVQSFQDSIVYTEWFCLEWAIIYFALFLIHLFKYVGSRAASCFWI